MLSFKATNYTTDINSLRMKQERLCGHAMPPVMNTGKTANLHTGSNDLKGWLVFPRVITLLRSLYKYISNHSSVSCILVKSFLSRPKYAIRGTGFLGRIWFGSSAAFGGRFNAPRPAVSVPHIDVNADGCRARRARSCQNTACRGGILEKLLNLDGCNA